MTRCKGIAGLLVGAIYMLAAICADGQQSSGVTEEKPQRTRVAASSAIPRTPAEMPPQPPRVTCDGDDLTIVARNSTVASVLHAIEACTGAEIVVPEGAAGERMFAELGPRPVRAVLTDLLGSMDLNYVIEASPSNPQKVQTVLLSRPSDDSSTIVASNGNVPPNWRTWLEAQQAHARPVSPLQDEPSQLSSDAALPAPVETAIALANSIPVDEAVVNPAPVASAAKQTAASEIASAPAQSSTSQNQRKSTEELIADLQRLYDQRKQMVQQQTHTVQNAELALSACDRVSN